MLLTNQTPVIMGALKIPWEKNEYGFNKRKKILHRNQRAAPKNENINKKIDV